VFLVEIFQNDKKRQSQTVILNNPLRLRGLIQDLLLVFKIAFLIDCCKPITVPRWCAIVSRTATDWFRSC